MSYATINQCANDPEFMARVTACCAKEGSTQPQGTAYQIIWAISAMSDIEAAYASALAGDNEHPGGDESVITDQMILSAVQANWPPDPVPPA